LKQKHAANQNEDGPTNLLTHRLFSYVPFVTDRPCDRRARIDSTLGVSKTF
jgi:hypothetical protein